MEAQLDRQNLGSVLVGFMSTYIMDYCIESVVSHTFALYPRLVTATMHRLVLITHVGTIE